MRKLNGKYMYVPVGMDIFSPKTQAKIGQMVIKVQMPGAPKNGTMGHCYIADAETEEFLGLVLENSLAKK